MNTSGLIFKMNSDGSAIIGYEDYGVALLGGNDYEVTYHLDAKNFSLLLDSLKCTDKLQARLYLVEEFGEEMNKTSFGEYCDVHGIMYKKSVWCG